MAIRIIGVYGSPTVTGRSTLTQGFPRIPGYEDPDPKGWNASAGAPCNLGADQHGSGSNMAIADRQLHGVLWVENLWQRIRLWRQPYCPKSLCDTDKLKPRSAPAVHRHQLPFEYSHSPVS